MAVQGEGCFGFSLKELDYWMIKRKDGEIVKYVIKTDETPAISSPQYPKTGYVHPSPGYNQGYTQGGYYTSCQHMGEKPIYSTPDGKVRLYIASATGCRQNANTYDFVVDCGDILKVPDIPTTPSTLTGLLKGDKELIEALDGKVEAVKEPARILQIDWDDRRKPEVLPAFWTALTDLITGDILLACQGGHGRSGTALTALMMCYTPEYSARDAIVHLRAMHCPRAIESTEQHAYLDRLASHLGRAANAMEVHQIKSFRDEFLKMQIPSALPYQTQLRNGGKS